jgi:NAD(P)-dependent dehydrogenase (short-subunit alcohol dehydrogenase family)
MNNQSLPSNLAIVTGASSGIGEAVVTELLERDWQVAGVSRRPGHFQHRHYRHLALDLADLGQFPGEFEKSLSGLAGEQPFARVALVNNAADPGLLGTTALIDPAQMQRVYNINVAAPTFLMGWLLRSFSSKVIRRIVNVSSGAAVAPFPGLGTYGNTKAALRMAGMVLAAEIDGEQAELDLTILSFEPGVVDTAMQETVRASTVEKLPIVAFFKQLDREGALVSPGEPAMEIVDYISSDGHPRFDERRL